MIGNWGFVGVDLFTFEISTWFLFCFAPRCGFLTYYIPFPLSFIHTQQPILQAAVLATYFDSPCKAKCNSSTTSASVSATPIANVTEAVLTVTTATPATTVSSSVEATATEAAAAATVVDAADNQTDYSSPSSSSFLNDSLLPMVNLTAEQVGNFNDMGQILLKFFGQIAAEQQQQQANNQQENAVTAVNLEATTNQTNTTANVDGSSARSNVTSSTLSISSNGNSSSSSSSSLSVLDRLRGSQRPRLEVTTCTATVCNEWSTERLLKARLCCLNSPEGESSSSSSSSSSEANSTMITSTTVSPGNSSSSSSSSSSGFGCTLYARRNQCSQIMPVIRCCLRKVLNKYFDFTIRLREQQQRSQGGGGGGNGGGGRQLGSLTVDHTGSIGGGQSLATSGGSAGGNGGGGLPREVVSLEYPADYVLGGVQQSDYLKQQHRKRVNRRVVGGGGVRR